MELKQIDTPSVVVDLDVAEANISRFQAYCDAHDLKVRPHIKTHKLRDLAKFQIAKGAIGITCQKVSEAEAMIAGGGIEDVLISYNILGPNKTKRLRSLAKKVRLTVVADNQTVANGLSEAFADAPSPLRVLVECNTGADRCGVASPEGALALAESIEALPGLVFEGLMTYPPVGGARKAQAWLESAIALIKSRGMAIRVISYGGSPDMWAAHEMPLATEYRIGTYAYNDRSLVSRGVCAWKDCALTVLATVVSVPSDHHAIIDAGSKVLTSDLLGLDGHGHVLGRDDLTIDQLSEEHGRIASSSPINLTVGQKVRIVPNHACVVANMLDHVEAVRGDIHLGSKQVEARGLVW